MSLRYSLLGLLARRPMSGYELTKEFDRTLWHAWSATHSQIYPELARLREEGLIEQTERGPRGRKTYAITDAGLAAVKRWLSETEPDRSSRSELILRTFFLWLLEQEQVETFLRREVDIHRRQLAEFEARARTLGDDDPAQRASRIALEWGIRYERGLAEWAEWALVEGLQPGQRARTPATRRAKTAPRR